MKKRCSFLLGLLILSVAILGGCNQQAQPGSGRILVILKTLQNPYFQEMRSGIEDEAKKTLPNFTLDIKSAAAEGDAAGQRRILDEYAGRFIASSSAEKLSGIIITPASSGPDLVPALSRFLAAQIPVVTLDTKLVGNEAELRKVYNAFRGSNNVYGGGIAGEEIRKALPSGGRILLLNGLDGHETATARREGFVAQFKDLTSYILTQRTCNWDRREARGTVSALLDGGQKFDFIFAANDEMALGALEARKQKQIAPTEMPIIGFDATDDAKEAVDRGELYGTIAQKPREMGGLGVQVLRKLIDKEGVERDELIPVKLIRKLP